MDRSHLTGHLAGLGHALETASGDAPLYAPASAEQAADLLGECTRMGWRVRLQGAGSRGLPAAPADVIVSARALTGFDIYEPDDLTVGVRAGTTHGWAAAELAGHQQFLPLDPPGPAAATLGGSIASGEAGPLRAGYGTPRDLTLGVTLAAADGRLLRLGGQVVKNVAGYDLVRLVVGSRGTLGLVTQLHVRLRALPPSDITLTAGFPAAAAAAAALLPLRDAVAPVALELLSPATAADPWQIALRLHGSAEATAAAVNEVRRLVPDVRTLDPTAATNFWSALARAESAAAVHLRLAALPGHLQRLADAPLRFLERRSGNGFRTWRSAAHGTEGVLRLWTSDPAEASWTGLGEAAAELGSTVASIGGTSTCDRGPEVLRRLLAGAPAPARVLELERELRLRFDPGSILAGV